jgi:high-affinity iron transporter
MIPNLVLAFRESLEAVLIIGIILTTLTRQNKQGLKPYVIAGSLSGIGLSILVGTSIFLSSQGFEEETMELFEGGMMLVASGLIAYFVIWMAQQNQNISASITSSVSKTTTGLGLAGLAFLGVFREGLELVIFTMANLSAQATDIALGTVSGIVVAVITGILIFRSTVKLNLGWIFRGLGLVMIYIGAELLEEGLIKLIPSASAIEDLLFFGYIIVALVVFFKTDLIRLVRKVG